MMLIFLTVKNFFKISFSMKVRKVSVLYDKL